MAVAFKEDLHRLVDEIPDTHPEIVGILFALVFRLIVASRNDELLFRRLLRELSRCW
jgi:hypothetical protein